MSDPSWFSARIRLVCLIECQGATRYSDSVYIFQARDFRDAFQKAVELGQNQEEEYLNATGQRVRWRLKEVLSLDVIPGETLDGVEVYSEPVELEPGESIPFDAELHPEQSEPTQTV